MYACTIPKSLLSCWFWLSPESPVTIDFPGDVERVTSCCEIDETSRILYEHVNSNKSNLLLLRAQMRHEPVTREKLRFPSSVISVINMRSVSDFTAEDDVLQHRHENLSSVRTPFRTITITVRASFRFPRHGIYLFWAMSEYVTSTNYDKG